MKRSVRDFFLTLLISVVIFAVAAFSLIGIAEGLMSDVVDKIDEVGVEGSENTTETSETSAPAGGTPSQGVDPGASTKDRCVSFLVVGLDRQHNHADAIFLVGINATRSQASVALIPTNTLVQEGNQKYRLGELYPSRGMNFFKEFVASELGVTATYTVAMSMTALENTVDFLGGVRYDVPENMYYYDSSQNLKINLKKGLQTLSGYDALGLVAYRGYAEGETAREDTQLSFVRSFLSTFLQPSNLALAKNIMYNVFYHVQSDFQEQDLTDWGSVIFAFGNYSQSFLRVPGENQGGYYAVSTSLAKATFQVYQ